jgi:hypothetical protein
VDGGEKARVVGETEGRRVGVCSASPALHPVRLADPSTRRYIGTTDAPLSSGSIS